MGPGVLGEDLALLHEVNRDAHLLEVQGHVVVEVPIEPVGLLDEHGTHLVVRVEVREHLLERAPSGSLRGLCLLEDAGDLEPVLRCVLFEQLQLRGNGEALRADSAHRDHRDRVIVIAWIVLPIRLDDGPVVRLFDGHHGDGTRTRRRMRGDA